MRRTTSSDADAQKIDIQGNTARLIDVEIIVTVMADVILENWDLCVSVMKASRETSVSKTNDLVKIAPR